MTTNLLRLMFPMLIGMFFSCKKNNPVAIPTSSLTIANVLQDSVSVMFNFDSRQSLKYFSTADTIGAYNAHIYDRLPGQVPLVGFMYPDSLHAIYNHIIQIGPNSIHTLFLGGGLTKIDSLYTTDVIPRYPPQDSLMGVRFVNFFGNKSPVKVIVQTNPQKVIVNKLNYGAATEFQPLSIKRTLQPSDSYVFEFRDLATNALIRVFTLQAIATRQSKSITLVLGGRAENPVVFVINPYFYGA